MQPVVYRYSHPFQLRLDIYFPLSRSGCHRIDREISAEPKAKSSMRQDGLYCLLHKVWIDLETYSLRLDIVADQNWFGLSRLVQLRIRWVEEATQGQTLLASTRLDVDLHLIEDAGIAKH